MQLRRITSGAPWIPQIDGLRFVAILSVVLYHITGQLIERSGHLVAVQPRYDLFRYMLGNGDRGVQLFFVISGYIIGRPFLRHCRYEGKPVPLGRYFLRRLTRLEPPYIISLLVYTLAFLARGVPFMAMLPHLGASILYLHNLIFHQISTISFVTWSLEVEVQFYILAPLLSTVFLVSNKALRRGLLIAAILLGGSLALSPIAPTSMTILGQFHYFLAGFLLADLLEGHQTQSSRHVLWDCLSILGWPAIFLLPRQLSTLAWLPLLIVPVYLAAFYGRYSNRFFRTPFVALAGGMCYSLYLTHMLVVSIVFKATRHLEIFNDFFANWLLQIIPLGLCVAAVGTAYYVLVERPCMDSAWPQKLWHRLVPDRSLAPALPSTRDLP